MFKMTRTQKLLAAIVLLLSAAAGVSAQSAESRAGGNKQSVDLKLTPEEARLVRSSRAALIGTGFTEKYFDAHFKPIKVHNTTGDRRVVWRFRLNDYETIVNDSIGFYTDARGQRINTHMVAASLGKTRDIHRTISFRRAQRAMTACIGEHGPGSILLQRFNADGRTSLVYTAVSVPPPAEPAVQSTPIPDPGPQPEGVKPGGKKKPFLSIGTIDLETGRCLKGVAQVGSPQPVGISN